MPQYYMPSNWNPLAPQYKRMYYPGDRDDDFDEDQERVDRWRKDYYDTLLVKMVE